MPENYIIGCLVQILKGLMFAHRVDVLHQDLKPENIFLMEDGSLKIADLGVSKVLASTDGRT